MTKLNTCAEAVSCAMGEPSMRVILSESDWPRRVAVRTAVNEWCRTEPGAPSDVAVVLGDFTEVDAKAELMGATLLQVVHSAIRGEA